MLFEYSSSSNIPVRSFCLARDVNQVRGARSKSLFRYSGDISLCCQHIQIFALIHAFPHSLTLMFIYKFKMFIKSIVICPLPMIHRYSIGLWNGIFYNTNQLLHWFIMVQVLYTILDKRHFCFALPTFPSLKCDGKKFSFARLPHWAGSIEGLTSKWRHQQKADFAPKMWVRPFLVTMKFIFTEGLVTF